MSMSMNDSQKTNCPEHSHCAYTGDEPDRCPFCHCPWTHVTAAHTETVDRTSTSKDGKRVTVQEVRQLIGCGHLPLEHLTLHVVDRRPQDRRALAAARREVAA